MALSKPNELPVEVISVAWQPAEADALLVRDEIRKVGDLRGRTIATASGSTSHYQLLYFLRIMNLASDVIVKLANPSEFADMWQRAEIDGVFVWVSSSMHVSCVTCVARMCVRACVLACLRVHVYFTCVRVRVRMRMRVRVRVCVLCMCVPAPL